MHSYSKLSPIYKTGDIKYYWRVHLKKMRDMGERPVTYARFWDRLERGWVLKEAIYTPNRSVNRKSTSLESNQWRDFIMFTQDCGEVDTTKDLDELMNMNRIQMPKPKPTLWQRIKRWILRKREK